VLELKDYFDLTFFLYTYWHRANKSFVIDRYFEYKFFKVVVEKICKTDGFSVGRFSGSIKEIAEKEVEYEI